MGWVPAIIHGDRMTDVLMPRQAKASPGLTIGKQE